MGICEKTTLIVLLTVFSLQILSIYPCVNAQITYPSPYWEYSPATPRVGDIITFNASLFEKSWNAKGESTIVSLVWHFGDGTSATGSLVTHTYTSSGSYLAGVTAKDDRGYGGKTEYEIQVKEQTPITVYVSLSSNTIYTGQEVTISGNLTYNGVAVPDTLVSLSSKTYLEGAVWNDIATVKTDVYGNYSAVWKTTYGYYQVRATWASNSTYPETSLSVILPVKDFGDLITEFSSNSTITGLNFNLTTLVLRFSVEGPSETSGYVNITLEKESTFDPQNIQVLFDGQPIEYHVDSTNQYWLLFFTYSHSTHDIVVNFKNEEIPEFPSWIILPLLIMVPLVVLVARNKLGDKWVK